MNGLWDTWLPEQPSKHSNIAGFFCRILQSNVYSNRFSVNMSHLAKRLIYISSPGRVHKSFATSQQEILEKVDSMQTVNQALPHGCLHTFGHVVYSFEAGLFDGVCVCSTSCSHAKQWQWTTAAVTVTEVISGVMERSLLYPREACVCVGRDGIVGE